VTLSQKKCCRGTVQNADHLYTALINTWPFTSASAVMIAQHYENMAIIIITIIKRLTLL